MKALLIATTILFGSNPTTAPLRRITLYSASEVARGRSRRTSDRSLSGAAGGRTTVAIAPGWAESCMFSSPCAMRRLPARSGLVVRVAAGPQAVGTGPRPPGRALALAARSAKSETERPLHLQYIVVPCPTRTNYCGVILWDDGGWGKTKISCTAARRARRTLGRSELPGRREVRA